MRDHWPKDLHNTSGLTTGISATSGKDSPRPAIEKPRAAMELPDFKQRPGVEYRQLRLEKVVLVGVWTQGSSEDAQQSMQELAALASTAGSQVMEGLIQRRVKPDPSTYIGKGKAEQVRQVVGETGADTVICDGELTPGQLIALEKVVKVKVIEPTLEDVFIQSMTEVKS